MLKSVHWTGITRELGDQVHVSKAIYQTIGNHDITGIAQSFRQQLAPKRIPVLTHAQKRSALLPMEGCIHIIVNSKGLHIIKSLWVLYSK